MSVNSEYHRAVLPTVALSWSCWLNVVAWQRREWRDGKRSKTMGITIMGSQSVIHSVLTAWKESHTQWKIWPVRVPCLPRDSLEVEYSQEEISVLRLETTAGECTLHLRKWAADFPFLDFRVSSLDSSLIPLTQQIFNQPRYVKMWFFFTANWPEWSTWVEMCIFFPPQKLTCGEEKKIRYSMIYFALVTRCFGGNHPSLK